MLGAFSAPEGESRVALLSHSVMDPPARPAQGTTMSMDLEGLKARAASKSRSWEAQDVASVSMNWILKMGG